jgi:type I restriction enzyme S subunit
MSEWKEVKLGDVCVFNPDNLNKRNYKFKNILYLDTSSVTENKFLSYQVVDINKAPSRAKRLVKNKDIIYSSVRPIQKHYAFIKNPKENLVVSTGFIVIRTLNQISKFIYYYLIQKQIINKLQQVAEQRVSTYPSITYEDIANLKINLPPLPIQKKIADILSVIDEKIETLQNINETLEEMAKAIFKSWFVDFEIVKAKASGKSDSEIAEEFGINEEIVKLFPSKFIDSEIGKIPKGWEIVYLKDVFDFERGVEPGSKFYIENPTNYEIQKDKLIPFYRVKDLETKANIYIPNEISKGKISKFGDVLVSFDGTIGRVNAFLEGAYSSGIRKIKATNYSNAFVYFLMKSDYIQDLIRKYATGTTILHAGKSINYLYLVKNDKIIKEYEKIIIPIFKTILSNAKQIQTLQNLRDTLLPKLINGEIKVDELDIRGIT